MLSRDHLPDLEETLTYIDIETTANAAYVDFKRGSLFS